MKKIFDYHSTKLAATLLPRPSHDKERRKKTKSSGTSGAAWKVEHATARVVVYGKMDNKDVIADLLSDEGLFFQHPTAEEYDPRIPYFNPHFLLRPGAEMPKIEELSVSDTSSATGKSLLDEVNHSKIWGIFDLANGPGASAFVTASRRLKSELQE